MEKKLIDIEVFPNFYFLGIKDFTTGEITSFEVSERKDQREDLITHLIFYKGYQISFNGIHYDEVINNYIVCNKEKLSEVSVKEFNRMIKEFSDLVIADDYDSIKEYKWYRKKYISIDLYLYWAKSLRISKKISLKGLAIQMGWNHIQELPYHPDRYLSFDEMNHVIDYNLKNDLGILEKLTDQFMGKGTIPLGNLGTIPLRHQIKNKYGLIAYSWDAPKIAAEAIIQEYCSLTDTDIYEFKQRRFDKENFKFKDLFKDINIEFKTRKFKNLLVEWEESYNDFNKEFVAFTNNQESGIKISVGVGGIHSVNKNEIYESNEDYIIYDLDIASLYPQLILNYNCFRYKELNDIYNKFRLLRINESKPNVKKYKGTERELFWKNEDLFYKVILNGISGYIDMDTSPLYNNIGAMKMRCAGQLIILYLTEIILENNIKVIQLNTDGITILIDKKNIDELNLWIKETEKRFNVEFESNIYKKMILQNVNSYLAIDKNDNIKEKGSFVTNPELGNSVDELVIAKALTAYFKDNIVPEVFIKNHKNILDFCISEKVDKSYVVKWTTPEAETIVCQNLNRFYASKRGGYIKKHRYGLEYNLLADSGVTVYNLHNPDAFPQDINYNYYIRKTTKKIQELEVNKKQLSLF